MKDSADNPGDPGFPREEVARLVALRRLEILDSPAEPGFDDIVESAGRAFDVPIAAFSLVDQDRQWFKASIGLGVQETSREVAFCAHAIHRDGVMLVQDATFDERFQNNAFVTGGPEIRFYAGVVVHSPDGHRIGTLCVIDTEPRMVSVTQLEKLKQLGKAIEAILARRKSA